MSFEQSHLNGKLCFFWMYATNYKDTWWLYDDSLNDQIEAMWIDYLKRKDNKENYKNINIMNSNVSNLLMTKTVKMKQSEENEDNHDKDKFDSNVNIISNIANIDFDDYDDYALPKLQNFQQNNKQLENLTYSITLDNTKYKIDFDQMKQLNSIDLWKKRNIRRLEFKDVSKLSPNLFREKYGVLGKAGIKFT